MEEKENDFENIKKIHKIALNLAREILKESDLRLDAMDRHDSLIGVVYANIISDFRNKGIMDFQNKQLQNLMGRFEKLLPE